MKKLALQLIVVVAIAIISITIANAQIISTNTGGLWSDPETWIGTIVPNASDDVIINGPVDVTSGAECFNITINSGQTLLSHGGGNINLNVYGNITNNGVIQNGAQSNLRLYIKGDTYNNGIWINSYTILNGTEQQSISMQENKSFDSDFSILNSSDTIKAMTYLSFTGNNNDAYFNINNNILNLNNHNIRFTGENTWFGNGTILSPAEFLGTVNISHSQYGSTEIKGDLIITDTLQNSNSYYKTVNLNGSLTNNGIIQNNTSYDLTLYISGDIVNNGTWGNKITYLNGMEQQSLTLLTGRTFDCNLRNNNSTDTIIALTNLTFTGYFYNNNNILDLNNQIITFIGLDTYFGSGTILNPSEFRGNVNMYQTTYIEGGLIISDTLQNKDNSAPTIYMNGNITNNGLIQNNYNNLNLHISGDISNNGIWKNSKTYFNGTGQQKITLQAGKTFDSNFENNNTNDTIIGLTDLSFTGYFKINNNVLNLNNHNIRFTGSDTYFGGGSVLNPNEFQGTMFMLDTQIKGNLIISDTLMNKFDGYQILDIYGNITNNGIIQNNTTYYLWLKISGDIFNNGTWNNSYTSLDGTTQQNISLQSGTTFNSNFKNENSTDTVKAFSDLHFTRNFDINNNVLNLDNHNIRFTGAETEFGKGSIVSPNEFLGTVNMFHTTHINGDLIVTDTLQTNAVAGSTLHISGRITNNGIVKNNTIHNLTLYISGDIVNNGIWENGLSWVNGETDQYVILHNDQPITGTVKFDANYGDWPWQWYYNDLVLDSPDFDGETSPYLIWLVPVSNTWYGTFHCQSSEGNSRDIIVDSSYGPPIADFIADTTIWYSPLEVGFTDLSIPGVGEIIEWFWDFGDGNSSILQNPTNIYDLPGRYTVSLIVTDENGLSDTTIKTDYIKVLLKQEIDISLGYSFVSSRIIPEDPDMLFVCNNILNNLDFVRNTAGYMLRKIGPNWINSIGNWVTTEGYLFKMNDTDELLILGDVLDPQTPINLTTGYQIISYLPDQALNTADVFQDVLDNLDFVRNTEGFMFRKIGPVWVNSIGDMQPDEGYLVKMLGDDVLLYPSTSFVCGNSFLDSRDGQTYETVQIGEQCWMAENLNIGEMIYATEEMTDNGIIEKYCYDNNPANCEIYGGLYQWNEMMEYSSTQGVQGICPSGWHLPGDDEFCTMATFLDPTVDCNSLGYIGTDVGGKMKSTGTIQGGDGLWNYPNTGATNESGFSAMPSGHRHIDGTSGNIGYDDWFWSSSMNGSSGWRWQLNYEWALVFRSYSFREFGFSVRCLMD